MNKHNPRDVSSNGWLQYPPFTTSRSIRVVQFDKTDGLSCTFREVSIDSKDENDHYAALSYSWAPEHPVRSIMCNGSPVEISLNLYMAMEALHDTKPGGNFWVDKISINQDDPDEKSQQVAMMRDIYTLSKPTIIWLGSGWNGAEITFNAIDRLQKAYLTARSIGIADTIDNRRHWDEIKPSLNIPDPDSPEVQGFDVLLSADWFSRAWCFQEAILGKDALVLCGNQTATWKDLHNAISAIQYLNLQRNLNHLQQLKYVLLMGVIAEQIHVEANPFHPRRSLISLLPDLVDRGAANARDKVYAYLGLVREGQDKETQPDYRKSVEQVYLNTVIHLLKGDFSRGRFRSSAMRPDQTQHPLQQDLANQEATQLAHVKSLREALNLPTDKSVRVNSSMRTPLSGLDVLNTVSASNRNSALPSWVPDLRCQPRTELYQRNADGSSPACAGGFTAANVVTLPTTDSIVGINGMVQDTIAQLSEPVVFTIDDEEHSNAANLHIILGNNPNDNSWYHLALTVALQDKYEVTGEKMLQVFLNTIVANHTPTNPVIDKDFKIMMYPIAMSLPTTDSSNQLELSQQTMNALQGERKQVICNICSNRRLFVSSKGFIGLAPQDAQVGDVVAIFFGGSTPYILRKSVLPAEIEDSFKNDVPAEDVYEYVGEAYVHGLMRGEAIMAGCGVQPPSWSPEYRKDEGLEALEEYQIPGILDGSGFDVNLFVDPDELSLLTKRFWLR